MIVAHALRIYMKKKVEIIRKDKFFPKLQPDNLENLLGLAGSVAISRSQDDHEDDHDDDHDDDHG